MVCSVRRERDIRGAGVEPDELGTTADLHPVGPVPAGPARDRGGNLIIEVEQLVSPRSVACSHVEAHAPGVMVGRVTRAPTTVIPPNCSVPDVSEPRPSRLMPLNAGPALRPFSSVTVSATCGRSRSVSFTSTPDADLVASRNRPDLDGAEQAKCIEPSAIFQERNVMEGRP